MNKVVKVVKVFTTQPNPDNPRLKTRVVKVVNGFTTQPNPGIRGCKGCIPLGIQPFNPPQLFLRASPHRLLLAVALNTFAGVQRQHLDEPDATPQGGLNLYKRALLNRTGSALRNIAFRESFFRTLRPAPSGADQGEIYGWT